MASDPFKICPSCGANRPITELYCGNTVNGVACSWSLYQEEIREALGPGNASTMSGVESSAPVCRNGHLCSPGDLFCPLCNEELIDATAPTDASLAGDESLKDSEDPTSNRRIGDWIVVGERSAAFQNQQQFVVTRAGDPAHSLLTLYRSGFEPDAHVYHVLQRFPRDHVPELKETGHWNGQAFEVCELLTEGSVRELPIDCSNVEAIEEFVREISRVLADFSEAGLRHRDIRPETILVRTTTPLDLVVSGFGSARLSDLDLEIAAPLETGRYTAPETMMGGVSAASDWWGLGMILLDKLTKGECFSGADDQLFMIHVIANGVTIPEDLPPRIVNLLRGLLAVDRIERWQWKQVQSWLEGHEVTVPASRPHETPSVEGPSIQLGDRAIRDVVQFTLTAARSSNWDEASDLLDRGALAAWAREFHFDSRTLSALEQLTARADIPSDFRLAIALHLLNPSLPLICRESIVSPAWLLQDAARGFDLLSGPVPSLLTRFGIHSQAWLLQLAKRAESVHRRAESLNIELDDERFHLSSVISSRAQLVAMWDERRIYFADANVPGLCSVMDRRSFTEEDLVLLCSAAVGQFRPIEEVLEATIELAEAWELEKLDTAILQDLLQRSRLQLYETLERRTEGFARCDQPVIDEWVDSFRVRRRLDIEKLLIVLSVPDDCWRKLPYQDYLTSLLSFFEKKVSASVLRGPLVKMTIGKTTPRVDVAELATDINDAQRLLERLLDRSDRRSEISPEIFLEEPNPEQRLRRLENHTATYLRDTGVNGLYLGFPFLVINDQPGRRQPRLSPVLLWPVVLKSSVGQRGGFSLAFDRDREEVRLNPAFEGLLGLNRANEWRDAANELLMQQSIGIASVMDAFGLFAEVQERDLRALPSRQSLLKIPDGTLIPAAVVFHVEFVGQSLVEDLKQLPGQPIGGTALETMLRIGEPRANMPTSVDQGLRYFVAESDPSQENAVSQAFHEQGIVVQGPPGTGKSQTIVNLISDAIGRQKSVLVVCQKLPALEVVRKRLVANGLKDRICMVTDVNRDRTQILKEIREQMSDISDFDPFHPQQTEAKRQDLLATIQSLESDLNEIHEICQTNGNGCGRSYLTVIDELLSLELESDTSIPNAEGLRRVLKGFSSDEIAALEASCADVARLWLNSDYENSPFKDAADFSHDDESISHFASDLQHLYETELARSQLITATPDAIEVENPIAAEEWLRRNQPFFNDLAFDKRTGFKSDVGWFLSANEGQLLLKSVETLLELRQLQPEACLDIEAMQVHLQSCSEARLRILAEVSSENAQIWIESRFWENPLRQMRDEEFAEASLVKFQNTLEELQSAEDHRQRVLKEQFQGRDYTDTDGIVLWLKNHGQTLRGLDQRGAQIVSALYDLFDNGNQGRSQGPALLRKFYEFRENLANLDLAGYSESIGRTVTTISPAEILTWFRAARYLASQPSLWGMLSPVRFLAQRRSKSFLTALGIPPVPENIVAFGKALLLEEKALSTRRDWKPPSTLVREPRPEAMSLIELKEEIESAVGELELAQTVVSALKTCPVGIRVDVSRLNNPQSFYNLVDTLDLSVRRNNARRDSMRLIDQLKAWMSESWVQEASQSVVNMIMPEVTSVIQGVLKFRDTAGPYNEMRHCVRATGSELAGVLESLGDVREQIESHVTAFHVVENVRAIVMYNGLKGRITRLLRQLAGRESKVLESPSELRELVNHLRLVNDVAERMRACPCLGVERKMLLSSPEDRKDFFRRLQAGIHRAQAQQRSDGAVDVFSKWMCEKWRVSSVAAIRSNSVDISTTTSLRDATSTLKDFLLFRRRWSAFSIPQRQCFEVFSALRPQLVNTDPAIIPNWVRTQIRRAALLNWKTLMENNQPRLLTERLELDRKVESLGNALQELREVDRTLLRGNFDRDSIRPQRDWEGITRLRGARAISLRQFFERGMKLGLRSLRPVWMMIPDVVSQVLPRIPSLFDVVIFDEASQMPVEHALPSLFRASTVVVSGDEKQMPPSSFFSNRIESDETEDEDENSGEEQLTEQARNAQEEAWNRRDIKDCPDLLHLAESNLPRTMLQIHYRSKYRELISFSNSAFYRNELSIPVTHPEEAIRRDRPVEFIPVNGVYSKQTNAAEAERVVSYLEAMWKTPRESWPSVGVVTFNRKQADLIEDLLEQRAEASVPFRDAFVRERNRTDNGEDMSLFIKNVESVQGDERDVIIFSTTFGRNSQGTFRRQFGVLSQGGGERRLNVAITRARRKVALMTSMPIQDVSDMLNLQRMPSSPRDYLQGYLEYAKLVSEGNFVYARQLIDRMSAGRRTEADDKTIMTGLQQSVSDFLVMLGYIVHRPEPDPILGVDFAILDPKTGSYGVGIECSPVNHQLLVTARMREIWRTSLIASKYRKFIRISGSEWFRNRVSEQRRIAAEIQGIIGEAE